MQLMLRVLTLSSLVGQFEVLEKFESVTKSHFMNWTNTNSIYGAKISSGQPKWPVIIYSHGQGA